MLSSEDFVNFVCIVAGENPEKQMNDSNGDRKRIPIFEKKDIEEHRKRNIETYEIIVENLKEQNFDPEKIKNVTDRIDRIKKMSADEFWKEITAKLSVDENDEIAYSSETMGLHFATFKIGQNFSLPFLKKDGSETYQAKKGDVDWEKMHKFNGEIYKRAWEMVMENDPARDEHEEMIYENMKNRIKYFEKFENKENYITYNTSFWAYAFLSKATGWKEVDVEKNHFEWVKNYFDTFITSLPDDTLLTVFECTKE